MLTGLQRKLRMAPDTYERHRLIAELVGDPTDLLDVGGIKGELGLFLPDTGITTINMSGEDADTHFDGDELPFGDHEFEVAVSLDVLEHIPHDQRALHFSELARVARRKVIICCPLGSSEHVEAERELSAWFRDTTGQNHRFLNEHLETGLPGEDELNRLAQATGHPHRLRFHGDFREANLAFMASTRLRTARTPRSLVEYARIRLNPRRSLVLDENSSDHSNRAFVELEITPSQANA